jgi:hypothetical protein
MYPQRELSGLWIRECDADKRRISAVEYGSPLIFFTPPQPIVPLTNPIPQPFKMDDRKGANPIVTFPLYTGMPVMRFTRLFVFFSQSSKTHLVTHLSARLCVETIRLVQRL